MSLTIRIEPAQRMISVTKLAPFPILFVLAVVDAIWASFLHLRFIGFELSILMVVVLLGVSVFYHSIRKDERLSEICYFAALWGLMMAASSPLTYMCATFNFRLYDEELDLMDRMLGFDWPSYYKFFKANNVVAAILVVAYYSMLLQLFFTVIYLAHIRKYERNYELFWATLISLVITSVMSGIFPAAGALYHYEIGLNHAVHLRDFFALRHGNVSSFSLRDLEGIVTFPSFHTAAAIMLIHAHRGIRSFRPVLLLNILMLLSTPISGGHYLVDMIGGGIVAFISICAAAHLSPKRA